MYMYTCTSTGYVHLSTREGVCTSTGTMYNVYKYKCMYMYDMRLNIVYNNIFRFTMVVCGFLILGISTEKRIFSFRCTMNKELIAYNLIYHELYLYMYSFI